MQFSVNKTRSYFSQNKAIINISKNLYLVIRLWGLQAETEVKVGCKVAADEQQT